MTKKNHDSARCADPACAICEHDLPFVLPEHLIQAAEHGRLVIFAGAGISTESSLVYPSSLLDEVQKELKPLRATLSFPAAMSAFCEQPDGRSKLLLKIRRRINYVRSHPELYWVATRFHRELSTIWQIQEIVTTNWDDFFERECGATPFITEKDLAFWSQPGRRVLKLHGSIHSLGEIVATTSDYERCYRQLSTGVLGSRLRTLLADRTVVFAGYSLNDPDFRQVFDALTSALGDLRPTYYIVTPKRESVDALPSNTHHINTDGTFFLKQLKAALLKFEHNLSDNRFRRLSKLRNRVGAAHNELFRRRPQSRYPETMYCASYQDGLMHAIDRANNLANTGEYSHLCTLIERLRRYKEIKKARLRDRNYWDVAYTEGYINGMLLVATEKDVTKIIPLYYLFGVVDQPASFASYARLAARAATLHRASFERARRDAKRGGNLTVHHTPFLDTSTDEQSERGHARQTTVAPPLRRRKST